MEFTRQEYWSGLSFPPPRTLSDPERKHKSPALRVASLPSEPSILLIEELFIFYADNFAHLMMGRNPNRPAPWSVIISIASLSLPTWFQCQLLKDIFILWYELWTCNFGSCNLHWHNSNILGSYFYIRLTSTNIIEMKLTVNLKSISINLRLNVSNQLPLGLIPKSYSHSSNLMRTNLMDRKYLRCMSLTPMCP